MMYVSVAEREVQLNALGGRVVACGELLRLILITPLLRQCQSVRDVREVRGKEAQCNVVLCCWVAE